MIATETDVALQRLIDEGRRRAATVDSHHALLWETLAAATEGGKRFRPALVMALHDALGGETAEAAAQVGAAVELLHTAFVIHDDVIDDDHVRRGRPNVSGTFQALARVDGADHRGVTDYGLTAGILAGDLALTASLRAVATCGAPPATIARLLDLFDTALHATAGGELADVRLSLGVSQATLAQSLQMEAHKTGAYSFSLPMQAGALLAGADDATVHSIGQAGLALGVAFQLADDVIGVFGDPERSGKSTTGDLRSAKQTPILVHARSTSSWPEISRYVGRDLTDDELETVRDLLTAAGSRAFVEELAAQHLADARVALEAAGVPGEVLDGVAGRTLSLTDREGAAA